MELLEQPIRSAVAGPSPAALDIDERAARRSLREQVSHLETELGTVLGSSFPHGGVDVCVAMRGGPRMLSLGELERLRDRLAERVFEARRSLTARTDRHERNRELIERMMLDPAAYKFKRVTREDLGESGCGAWEVRPRLGIIGMLMGWWQVKISSGCPLAWAAEAAPATGRLRAPLAASSVARVHSTPRSLRPGQRRPQLAR